MGIFLRSPRKGEGGEELMNDQTDRLCEIDLLLPFSKKRVFGGDHFEERTEKKGKEDRFRRGFSRADQLIDQTEKG
jgi:hypothetical protein